MGVDLRNWCQGDFELTWLDGTVLHIPVPPQNKLNKIVECVNAMSNLNESDILQKEKILELIISCFYDIVNSNKELKFYSEDDIKNTLTIGMCIFMIEEYTKYVSGVLGK